MSFTSPLREAAWGKFVAWSALVLAGASLTLMLVYVVVLGLDDFSPWAELQVAGSNPAAYRLNAALDMLNWLGIGGLLIGFAALVAARAPIRALLLAACAVRTDRWRHRRRAAPRCDHRARRPLHRGYAIANQVSVVAVGELLRGFLFMAFQIGDALVALAVFLTFWQRSSVPSPRIGLASAG